MKFKVAGIVSAIAIMAALSQGAYAQTANSTSGAQSSSGASSGSQSGAVAVGRGGTATGNSASQGVNTNANLSSGVTVDQRSYGNPSGSSYNQNYSGGTNNYSTERQTGDVTVRTTPTVYAPPVSGGNPCTLAVSGGVSVIGWGAAAGGTFVDEDCANRQKIAMIHNAGRPDLAFELMCNDKATYVASRNTVKPCTARPQWDGTPAPMASVQPAPVVVTPAPQPVAAPKQYPRCNPRLGITDNCVS
jgi:hypothetical protein